MPELSAYLEFGHLTMGKIPRSMERNAKATSLQICSKKVVITN